MLITRSFVGKDVKVEKSKVCEWVKLPALWTTHIHPSLLGAKEFPDTACPFGWGCGAAEGCGVADSCGDGDADAEEPQVPKVG